MLSALDSTKGCSILRSVLCYCRILDPQNDVPSILQNTRHCLYSMLYTAHFETFSMLSA